MKSLKYIYPFLSLAVLFLTCTEPTEPTNPGEMPAAVEEKISDHIIAKADSFIISKTGPEFFHSYIRYDSSRTRFVPPDSFCITHPSSCSPILQFWHYSMTYTFGIPEKAGIHSDVYITLDSAGNIVMDETGYGIPNCTANPGNCLFNIDSAAAVSLARQAGLEEGVRPWRVQFNWTNVWGINGFVWNVSNTLNVDESSMGGRAAVIDAHNGALLGFLGWMAIE